MNSVLADFKAKVINLVLEEFTFVQCGRIDWLGAAYPVHWSDDPNVPYIYIYIYISGEQPSAELGG